MHAVKLAMRMLEMASERRKHFTARPPRQGSHGVARAHMKTDYCNPNKQTKKVQD